MYDKLEALEKSIGRKIETLEDLETIIYDIDRIHSPKEHEYAIDLKQGMYWEGQDSGNPFEEYGYDMEW